jgi:hypothetical protein
MEEIQSKFVLGGRTIYIISNWVDDGFELTLTDGKHAFHGAGTFHFGVFSNATPHISITSSC